MRAFHAIAGVPRSGSTLLANLLNQRPDAYASSTSHVPQALNALSMLAGTSPEVKSALIHGRARTDAGLAAAMRGYVEGWYVGETRGDRVVFDKSRLWNHSARLFETLWPEGVIVVCVRDLRDVLASAEKQHARTALYDDSPNPLAKSLLGRADALFGPEGVIGQAVLGVDDLLRRKPASVHVVKYEDMIAHPKTTMAALAEECGLEPFAHDFENVKATAEDVDGLYLHKWPHVGSGKVAAPAGSWREWVSDDIAQQVLLRYPGYSTTFGYK